VPRALISMRLPLIAPGSPPDSFPDPARALGEPNGLLAAGGDLLPERLVAAYRAGIFPWFDDGDPILWWSPDPRALITPDSLDVSASLARTMRRGRYRLSCDLAFEAVVEGCAGPRPGSKGTWIVPAMRAAYALLHREGLAHSVECWDDEGLAGGIYGVAVGGVFCGESMFSRRTDASKVALVALLRMLVRRGGRALDCQLMNPHLVSLGATAVPRAEFLGLLHAERDRPLDGDWSIEPADLRP